MGQWKKKKWEKKGKEKVALNGARLTDGCFAQGAFMLILQGGRSRVKELEMESLRNLCRSSAKSCTLEKRSRRTRRSPVLSSGKTTIGNEGAKAIAEGTRGSDNKTLTSLKSLIRQLSSTISSAVFNLRFPTEWRSYKKKGAHQKKISKKTPSATREPNQSERAQGEQVAHHFWARRQLHRQSSLLMDPSLQGLKSARETLTILNLNNNALKRSPRRYRRHLRPREPSPVLLPEDARRVLQQARSHPRQGLPRQQPGEVCWRPKHMAVPSQGGRRSRHQCDPRLPPKGPRRGHPALRPFQMMVVGLGEAGKTSLLRAMQSPDCKAGAIAIFLLQYGEDLYQQESRKARRPGFRFSPQLPPHASHLSISQNIPCEMFYILPWPHSALQTSFLGLSTFLHFLFFLDFVFSPKSPPFRIRGHPAISGPSNTLQCSLGLFCVATALMKALWWSTWVVFCSESADLFFFRWTLSSAHYVHLP